MDMPELNNNSDNAFLELMKELPDLEDEAIKKPQHTNKDI